MNKKSVLIRTAISIGWFPVTDNKHTHKLSTGTDDTLDVYREGTITYVLSHNYGLGYFGLEVFEGSDKVGDIFVESHHVKETIGRNDLAPFNNIKRMEEYIQ